MLIPKDKVLVVTAGHVGNTLFCTPAIHLLKKHHPKLQIDAVTLHQRAANALLNNPDINRIYVIRMRWQLSRLIKKYPLTICLNNYTFNDYIGPAKENVITVGPADAFKHRAEEVLLFMQQLLNCEVTPEDHHYILYPLPKDVVNIQTQVKKNTHQNLVGIHLGGGRTQIHGWKFWYKKRTQDRRLWPLENYIELGERLHNANPNLHFVVTGGSNERFLGKAFAKKIPHTLNFIGETTVSELAALIPCCRVFVTHDTGILHVACATKVPLVGIFGSTNPSHTGPYPLEKHHTILRQKTIAEVKPADVCAAVLEKIKNN